jgi:preprotein translocase subunit SecA
VVGREEAEFMKTVIAFAETLEKGPDFIVDAVTRQIRVTDRGDRKIRQLVLPPDTQWTGTIRRNEMVRRAISAIHLFERDKDYLVRDGKVQIIDAFTGRVMPDRSWEQGLQQLIEIKEGCEITQQQETVAKISFQRFFRRYLHLAGMTGTAREVTGELWAVYGLPVVRIHTHRPLKRKGLPDKIFYDRETRDRFLVERVRELHATGKPVLIGTGSVAASEASSRLLNEAGLYHAVLNAKNDAEEASIVAQAGIRGAITIATNMAGRGTDIKLAPGVTELGGLHVILTELHEAARIDRQLAGRCARQGDPGCYEAILLLDDSVIAVGKGGLAGFIIRKIVPKKALFWSLTAKYALVNIQKETERYHGRMRLELFKHDVLRKKLMSFSRCEE